ncbi:MAG: mannose-1-phosphate guanyltransferase [Deltaproteobacteria bacterium]|nr:mannose-1-phosphate guanyltransferase [Deltaproteobacteria bacterium]
MKCIIMAGGFGTRLRPITSSLPKPMVPMANKPIIGHIVELLKGHSITDLTALLYFQPEPIVDYLADGSAFGVKMRYVTPPADFGTAGSTAHAMRKEKAAATLVISGDVLTDIDLTKAIKFHKEKEAVATVVLTRVEDPLSYGIVITDDNGRVLRFLEKPGWGEVFSDTINTGIYILEKDVLEFIPEDKEFDFSNDLFPMLLGKDKPLYGFVADGYWKDVGSLQEYRQANMDVLRGKVRVNVPGKERRNGVWIGDGTKMDFASEIGDVIIGRNCRIDAGAKVVNSVVGDNAVIEEGAAITDSVLWNDITIGRGARLQENIVGDSTEICDGAHLGEGVVVSDHCRIGRNSTVRANVKVWPRKEVDDEATLASSLIWADRWSKNIFSAYGVTGLANIELSPEFAAKLGAAYGASLPRGSVVSTSRDAHKTSRMINRAIMTGILSTGVNVHDYGVTPMPVVRFLAKDGNEAGGVHTRRSPFEPQLIDLKFFDRSGLDLHPGQERTIERLFFREDFRRVSLEETGEMVFPIHAFEMYQGGFLSKIDGETIKKAGFKIVLDYSYGSSSRIFPSILGRLNCEVIALNANLDGSKVTRTREEFDKSLKQLSTIVRSLRADVGFLLDAGGEKVFLVGDTGDVIDGETALDLVALLVCKTGKIGGRKGHVAVPVTAPRAIEKIAASNGFKTLRTKTTARGLMEAAIRKDVLFVGEETGGFVFPDFQPVFDGMYAVAKILEMLAKEGRALHRLIKEIPPGIMVKERVPCAFEHKGMIMRRLAEDSRGKKTTLVDGIRINFGDDWIIAYPSQSHSYFHIVAEASTEDRAKGLVEKYTEKIRQWQKEAAA